MPSSASRAPDPNVAAAPTNSGRRVLLASGSPQRRAILAQLAIRFRVEIPGVDENASGDADAVAIGNSALKAHAAAHLRNGDDELVIGVDTIVVLNNGDAQVVLGKPHDEADARRMLELLRGRRHVVISGLTMLDGELEHRISAETTVQVRPFDQDLLDRYLASGDWRNRAGGYAIQGGGAALIASVEGDYQNVVGFPVAAWLDLLDDLDLTDLVLAHS